LAANAKNQTALACPHNQHEDAFGMMAKRPVTKIHGDRLGLVDYVDSHWQCSCQWQCSC
jgi:hypothetical protein